eukprot:5799-Heterococcus_DN1.PRE.3
MPSVNTQGGAVRIQRAIMNVEMLMLQIKSHSILFTGNGVQQSHMLLAHYCSLVNTVSIMKGCSDSEWALCCVALTLLTSCAMH